VGKCFAPVDSSIIIELRLQYPNRGRSNVCDMSSKSNKPGGRKQRHRAPSDQLAMIIVRRDYVSKRWVFRFYKKRLVFFCKHDNIGSRGRPWRMSSNCNEEKRSLDRDIGRRNDQDRVRLEKARSNIITDLPCAGMNVAKMPPKKPAASKQRQQSHLEKDEQIHFKLHVPPKISEQLSNTFWRP
jgi:hypothetical protein